MPSEAKAASSKPSDANKRLRSEELLSQVANRDVEALESLYDQFSSRLMGLLMRILSARPAAEGALQEVFLRLWKEAPGIAHTQGSVAAWLVLTARHVALRRLRAQRTGAGCPAQSPHRQGLTKEEKRADKSEDSVGRKRKSGERAPTQHSSPTLSFLAASPQFWMPRPEDLALVDARLGLLQRAFTQMPQPQRRALELAVFDAYTESEIAAQLGEPLGRVTAGLRAAFTFLRHRQRAVLGTWTADI
jgi:RNA polymerase sigma factor (sigma-70 family)